MGTVLGTVAGGAGWGACWWQCFQWPQLLTVLRRVDTSEELPVVSESVLMGQAVVLGPGDELSYLYPSASRVQATLGHCPGTPLVA